MPRRRYIDETKIKAMVSMLLHLRFSGGGKSVQRVQGARMGRMTWISNMRYARQI